MILIFFATRLHLLFHSYYLRLLDFDTYIFYIISMHAYKMDDNNDFILSFFEYVQTNSFHQCKYSIYLVVYEIRWLWCLAFFQVGFFFTDDNLLCYYINIIYLCYFLFSFRFSYWFRFFHFICVEKIHVRIFFLVFTQHSNSSFLFFSSQPFIRFQIIPYCLKQCVVFMFVLLFHTHTHTPSSVIQYKRMRKLSFFVRFFSFQKKK